MLYELFSTLLLCELYQLRLICSFEGSCGENPRNLTLNRSPFCSSLQDLLQLTGRGTQGVMIKFISALIPKPHLKQICSK